MTEQERFHGLTPNYLKDWRGRIKILNPEAPHNHLWECVINQYFLTIPEDLTILIVGRIDEDENGGETKELFDGDESFITIALFEWSEGRLSKVLEFLNSIFKNTLEKDRLEELFCSFTFLHELAHYINWFGGVSDDALEEDKADVSAYSVLERTLSNEEYRQIVMFIKAFEYSFVEERFDEFRRYKEKQRLEIPANNSGNGGPSATAISNGSGDSATALSPKEMIVCQEKSV